MCRCNLSRNHSLPKSYHHSLTGLLLRQAMGVVGMLEASVRRYRHPLSRHVAALRRSVESAGSRHVLVRPHKRAVNVGAPPGEERRKDGDEDGDGEWFGDMTQLEDDLGLCD
jgi:hypothetical protein